MLTLQVQDLACGLSAIQGWICVLGAHGVDEGNLFLQTVSNMLLADHHLYRKKQTRVYPHESPTRLREK